VKQFINKHRKTAQKVSFYVFDWCLDLLFPCVEFSRRCFIVSFASLVTLSQFSFGGASVILDVLFDELLGNGLLTVEADSDGGCTSHLSNLTGLLVFAVTEPFSEEVLLLNVDKGASGVLGESL
jgi:hypothetical protein